MRKSVLICFALYVYTVTKIFYIAQHYNSTLHLHLHLYLGLGLGLGLDVL